MRTGAVCVCTGLVFGIYHMDWMQVIPAALLGTAITWIALTTDSLWPAVLFHLLFNSTTVVMAQFVDPSAEHGAVRLVIELMICATVAVISIALGVRLLSRGGMCGTPCRDPEMRESPA